MTEEEKIIQAQLDRRFATFERELVTQKESSRIEINALRELHDAEINGLRREVRLAQEASEKAIVKSENANEKRFSDNNEWRLQSAERERSQQEERAKLESTFMLREVADSQFSELRKITNTNTDRINTIIGEQHGRATLVMLLLTIVAVLATIAAVISPHIP